MCRRYPNEVHKWLFKNIRVDRKKQPYGESKSPRKYCWTDPANAEKLNIAKLDIVCASDGMFATLKTEQKLLASEDCALKAEGTKWNDEHRRTQFECAVVAREREIRLCKERAIEHDLKLQDRFVSELESLRQLHDSQQRMRKQKQHNRKRLVQIEQSKASVRLKEVNQQIPQIRDAHAKESKR